MKLKQILLGFLGLGLLAACSQDDVVPSGGDAIERDGGYLAVNIQLPTTPSTRAANDNYDDGLADEYKVDNAMLVIMQGANEKDATVAGAYKLYDNPEEDKWDNETGDANETPADNITTQYQKCAKIDGVNASNGNLYALIFLNYDVAVANVEDGKLKINGTEFEGNFSSLLSSATSNDFYSTGKDADGKITYSKFFMANAPLSKKKGSEKSQSSTETITSSDASTLVSFDISKIKDNPDEAKADPAASVYVERAVAKASMNTPQSFTVKIGEEDFTSKCSLEWLVDNTENTSYIVRNLGEADYLDYSTNIKGGKYANKRFVGTQKMGKIGGYPEEDLYRIYWCEDPNYNNDNPTLNTVGNLDFSAKSMTEGDKEDAFKNVADKFKSTGTIFYPHENTFKVENQDYRNTTRAIFKLNLKLDNVDDDGTFYTVDGNAKELFNKSGAENKIYALVLDPEATEDDNPDEPSTRAGSGVTGKNSDITNAFKDAMNDNQNFTYGKDNVIISFETSNKGEYLVKSIVLTVPENMIGDDKVFKTKPTLSADVEKDLIDYLNETHHILKYVGGNCYYDIRFKHFAGEKTNDFENDLAPWIYDIDKPTETINKTDDAYEGSDAANNYLGRYGMVRNNWYDITVSAIKNLGSPVVPELDVTSDDNVDVDKYISFKINVLSWAKRTQNVEF